MTEVVISIGSNAPDREKSMEEAIRWLTETLDRCRVSDVYETPEYSGRYPSYFNCVAEGFTMLDVDSLNELLKDYERSHGRTSESKRTGIVPIDLDIVKYGDTILRQVEFCREYFAIGYRRLRALNT